MILRPLRQAQNGAQFPAHLDPNLAAHLPQAALVLPVVAESAPNHAIAVAEPAAAAAFTHSALEAAPGLVGEVLEVEVSVLWRLPVSVLWRLPCGELR